MLLHEEDDYFIPHVIFWPILCMQLLFYPFSTLMSLEDRVRARKIKKGGVVSQASHIFPHANVEKVQLA